MVPPNWQHVRDVLIDAKLVHGYWTLALEYVDSGTRLRIEVQDTRTDGAGATTPNTWKYGDQVCTADGDIRIPINLANSLLPEAPAGALIGKIGGSRAGKREGSVSFVAGSYCVLELIEKQRGPLYLAMNVEPGFVFEPSGQILVRIFHSA